MAGNHFCRSADKGIGIIDTSGGEGGQDPRRGGTYNYMILKVYFMRTQEMELKSVYMKIYLALKKGIDV